jgi:hypothetical protein
MVDQFPKPGFDVLCVVGAYAPRRVERELTLENA